MFVQYIMFVHNILSICILYILYSAMFRFLAFDVLITQHVGMYVHVYL